MFDPQFPMPDYYICEDCGERFDRTEMHITDAYQLCDTDYADVMGAQAAEAYAEYVLNYDYHARPAVPGYDPDDPKHPDYVWRLLDRADDWRKATL